jgi:hypothetical protein
VEDSSADGKEDQNDKPPPRKLDQTFVTTQQKSITSQVQEKKALTFSTGTNFPKKTVDSSVKRIAKVNLANKPTPVMTPPNSTPIIPTKTLITTKTTKPPNTKPTPVVNDPAPQGNFPEPVVHSHSFVARVAFTVPNCSSFQHKVMNLLAYAMHTQMPPTSALKIQTSRQLPSTNYQNSPFSSMNGPFLNTL